MSRPDTPTVESLVKMAEQSILNDELFLCPEDMLDPYDNELQKSKSKLFLATGLCFVFFLIEFIAGIVSGSLAILSDSFHLLSDIAGFALSIGAIYLSQQPATRRLSFGFYRAEIIGAILSTFLIWILTAILVYEAIQRIKNPTEINGELMAITAAVGVVMNIVLGFTLHSHGHSHGHSHKHDEVEHNHEHERHSDTEEGHEHEHEHEHELELEHEHEHEHEEASSLLPNEGDTRIDIPNGKNASHKKDKKRKRNINVESAVIHVIGDLLSSIGVLIASLIIWYKPEYQIVDPICTFIFSIIVLMTTSRLIYNSLSVLMEATPSDIDPTQVLHDLEAVEGVSGVHDLHIWNLTLGKVTLSAHVQVYVKFPDTGKELTLTDYNATLLRCQRKLCQKYGIHHATIQLESDSLLGIRNSSDSDEENSINRNIEMNCGESNSQDASSSKLITTSKAKNGSKSYRHGHAHGHCHAHHGEDDLY